MRQTRRKCRLFSRWPGETEMGVGGWRTRGAAAGARAWLCLFQT